MISRSVALGSPSVDAAVDARLRQVFCTSEYSFGIQFTKFTNSTALAK